MKKLLSIIVTVVITMIAFTRNVFADPVATGYQFSKDGFGYEVVSIEPSKVVDIINYSGNQTNIVIPDVVDDDNGNSYSVSAIRDEAFYNKTDICSIIIPDSITTILDRAFENCTSLRNVTIGCGITNISENAFNSCSKLSSLIIKATTAPNLGNDVFGYCPSDLKIYVPNDYLSSYQTNWGEYSSLFISDIQNHDYINFIATTSLPDTAGNYFLATDVELNATWNVPNGEVNLCLNGHVIKANASNDNKFSAITIGDGSKLNLYDCNIKQDTPTEHKGYIDANGLWHLGEKTPLEENEVAKAVYGGLITGGNSENGGAIFIDSGGSAYFKYVNIIGNQATNGAGIYNKGTIDAGFLTRVAISSNRATNGGGIYNMGNVSFNNPVIELKDNYATNGGAIYNTSYILLGSNYFPGEINGCVASSCGGIAYNSGFLGISYIEASDCSATYGGAFYNCGGGRVEIVNNIISNCSATDGGAIYNCLYESAMGESHNTTTIDGNTQIYDCFAEANGGAIFNGDVLALGNVSITNNNCGQYGGGVYNVGVEYVDVSTTDITGNVFVGKKPVVNNNVSGNGTNNVYLSNKAKVIIGSSIDVGSPTNGMDIGISMDIPGVFTKNDASGQIGRFKSDSLIYDVVYDSDNKLKLSSNIPEPTPEPTPTPKPKKKTTFVTPKTGVE